MQYSPLFTVSDLSHVPRAGNMFCAYATGSKGSCVFLTLVVVQVPWLPKVTRRVCTTGSWLQEVRVSRVVVQWGCFLRRSRLALVTGTSYLPLSRHFNIIYVLCSTPSNSTLHYYSSTRGCSLRRSPLVIYPFPAIFISYNIICICCVVL